MTGLYEHDFGMTDLIQAAALVENGVVALRDGGYQAAWQIEGADFNAVAYAATEVLRDSLAGVLNHGRGWVFETNVIKTRVSRYPAWGDFPLDAPVARLIEDERRANYTSGEYFESRRYMSLSYFPASTGAEKAQGWFYETPESGGLAEQALRTFNARVDSFESLCSAFLSLRRLGRELTQDEDGEPLEVDELLRYLRLCVSGKDVPFPVPDVEMDLDLLLGAPAMFGGMRPSFGPGAGFPVRVLALDPMPRLIFPGMLRHLEALPIEFRLHTRAILLDQQDAAKLHKANVKRHSAKIQSFMSQVMKTPGRVNTYAADLAAEADYARGLAEDIRESTSMFSARVVLVRDSEDEMRKAITLVKRAAEGSKLLARVETLNACEAWCASLPGHAFFDIRHVPLRSFNVAGMAPLHSSWRGEPRCPSKLFPPNSSPLVIGTGDGEEIFTHNLHVSDVGHAFVFGPVGAGKTTLFGLHAASLLRYPGARVVMFDRMRTQYVLCRGLNGKFYDFSGGAHVPKLCPLQHLDTESDRAWAAEWIENRCATNSLVIGPDHRALISATLERFRRSPFRSLTHFAGAVGERTIAEALQLYTVGNTASAGVLDGERDDIEDSHFTVFEMAELMTINEQIASAVMSYLFRRIERKLNTSYVTGIFIDEARRLILDPVFGPQIKNWLAEIRQRNAFVMMATQEIEDIAGAPASLRSAIEQECRTKIFLPNAGAKTQKAMEAYQSLGLNTHKIRQVAAGIEKREYFIAAGERWSRVAFDLSPATLAFIASNSDEHRAQADRMIEANPKGWQADWLMARGLSDWADYLKGLL